jgi:hypothetical protein
MGAFFLSQAEGNYIMAIEVIKQGQIPAKRKYIVKCSICETEFSFLQKDGKIQYDQRDGDSVLIHCPTCKTLKYVGINTYVKP